MMFSEKACPAPPPVDNAMESGEYTYGSTVVYTCLRGYYRSAGGHHIVCNNGTWQGTKPTCTSEYDNFGNIQYRKFLEIHLK